MNSSRALLSSGILLLTVSALLGFVQYRHRDRPEAFAHWRVVHAGGTAGAIQLLALSAVWAHFGAATASLALVAGGLILATWAFFLGPLAKALGRLHLATVVNSVGAAAAIPSYLCLPLLLL